MQIMVLDGQGGGLGKCLVEKLMPLITERDMLVAVGTNSIATLAMRKAGTPYSATGENAVVVNAARSDIIVGSVAILAANSMMGELSPAMARAVAESPARKILIPLNRCGIVVAGLDENKAVAQLISDTVELIRPLMR